MNKDDKILAHFGIKGMRWGHTKQATVVQKSNHSTSGREVSTSIKSKLYDPSDVRAKKAAIKSKKNSRWDAEIEAFSKKEEAMNAKLDQELKNHIKKIDASKRSRIQKFIAKGLVKNDISYRRMNIVGKLEDEDMTSSDKRNKEHSKRKEALVQKYAEMWDKATANTWAGKSFMDGVRHLQKMDKELSKKLVDDLLDLELEFA